MRDSTRGQYTDKDILQSAEFKNSISERDYKLFLDWIGGMNGRELGEKYWIAEITARQALTKAKLKYDLIYVERNSYGQQTMADTMR